MCVEHAHADALQRLEAGAANTEGARHPVFEVGVFVFGSHCQETRKAEIEEEREERCMKDREELMELFLDFRICSAEKLICPAGYADFVTAGLPGGRRPDQPVRRCFKNEELLGGKVDEILRNVRQVLCQKGAGRNDLRQRETRSTKERCFQKFASRYGFWLHKTPQ